MIEKIQLLKKWVSNGELVPKFRNRNSDDLTTLLNQLENEAKKLSQASVSGRSELLITYTKWLRDNNHLQSAPFPSLIKQFEAINSH